MSTYKLDLELLEKDFIKIAKEHDRALNNYPKTEQYELAMIGNSLFKSK